MPLSADAVVACEVISSTTAKWQAEHPDAFMVISGDFNDLNDSDNTTGCVDRNKAHHWNEVQGVFIISVGQFVVQSAVTTTISNNHKDKNK